MVIKRLLKAWRIHGSGLLAEFFGGLAVNGPRAGILTTAVYGANIAIDASLGDDFVVTITDNVAFTIAAPNNTPPTGYDQVINLTFRNASGGAHGAGTFNAIYKTAAAGFPAIATGFSRTFTFRWNGTNWVEWYRSAADIAN